MAVFDSTHCLQEWQYERLRIPSMTMPGFPLNPRTLSLSFLAAGLVHGSAQAGDVYVTGAVGFNSPTTRTNSGDIGSFTERSLPGASTELGFGFDFGALRVEATYTLDASRLNNYTSVNDQTFDYVSGGDVRKQSAFLSGYWDVLLNESWTPYLGVGMGYTNLDVRSFSDPGLSYAGFNRSLFGYQFKAGISIEVNPATNLFVEGVYRGTSEFKTNDGFNEWDNASYASWGSQIGVRIDL